MNELEIKTERLVAMMKAEDYGGFLLNSQHNFAWLTGGKNNGVDLSQVGGVGSILVRNDGKRYLLANNVEIRRFFQEEVSCDDFEEVDFSWEADKSNPRHVLRVAERIVGHKLGTDLFMHPAVEICEGFVAKCRYQLTSEEIERFRTLGKDAGKILDRIYTKIEPGQTEKEIANIVRLVLGSRGINSVVTLVAADERITKYRHPIPTDNVWRKTLLIVTCAKRDGLIVSLSRIFSVGNVSDDLRKRTEAVAKVHAQMMHTTRPNATGKEIFEVTKNAYRDVGFANEETKHHQGGATGYKTRDWVAHSQNNERVLVNQAFAWNPSITGTKSEETFLVKEDGIEVITASPNFPTVETVIDGTKYLTPDILVI